MLGSALALAVLLGLAEVAMAQESGSDLFAEEDLGDDDLFGDEDLFGGEAEEDEAQPLEADAGAGEEPAPALGEAAAPTDTTAAPEAGAEGLAPEADPIGDAGGLEPVPSRGSEGVEEIVVRGQAAVGTLPDEAVSVTTFDAEDLLAMGVENVADVAQYTPNLEIRAVGSSTATFFIRGVGLNDFTANASGSVAIYVDESPMNLPAIQLGQLFDTANVEVLKGPQGSGPGRNASAGAIRIYTRKPSGEFAAFGRLDYGNFQYVDAEGALEIPLYSDILATRVAFRVTDRDGIVENRCGGKTPSQIAAPGLVCNEGGTNIRPHLAEDMNDQHNWAARATLRFLPEATEMDWILSGHLGQIDQLGTVGEHLGSTSQQLGLADRGNYRSQEVTREHARITARLDPPNRVDCVRLPAGPDRDACFAELEAPNRALARTLANRPLDRDPFSGDYNNPGYERMSSFGGQLRGEYELGGTTLTWLSGYERYDRERLIDADYSPNQLFEFDIADDAWQFTQDFRIEGELESEPLSWGAGVFYLMEKLEYDQETLTIPAATVRPLSQGYEQRTWGLGVYGEFEWELLDDFSLEAGIRYNWERKSFDAEISRGPLEICNLATLPVDCSDESIVDHPTGTLGLSYRFDDERSVYAKYSHGWKASQFNARDGNPATVAIDIASPEAIHAFEFGFRGAWFDGALELNGAMFWYLYENYQVFTFSNDFGAPAQRIVLNANDAQLHGAELEGLLTPIEGLKLQLRAGWLESKFLDFSDTGARPSGLPNVPTQLVFDFDGNRLPNTPRFKFSGNASYELSLGRYGALVPRWDLSWTDDVFFNQTNGHGLPGAISMPNLTIGQEAVWLHNARLTYRTPSGQVELSGWVRNVTDEVYKTLSFDASAGPGLVGNLLGDPRTYGLSVRVSF